MAKPYFESDHFIGGGPGDVLLAQKLALELWEADALMVANALAPSSYMRARYSGLTDRLRG
jgi:hypothetical protein